LVPGDLVSENQLNMLLYGDDVTAGVQPDSVSRADNGRGSCHHNVWYRQVCSSGQTRSDAWPMFSVICIARQLL